MADKYNHPLLVPVAIVLAGMVIAFAVFLTRADDDATQTTRTADTNARVAGENTEDQEPEELESFFRVVEVEMDDDPTLGNPDSSVVMVEFSDYECPYCKRHSEETNPEIFKNFVDNDKIKYVFRDFIAVSSHNPAASVQANAAECAGDLAGDDAYFEFHDKIFESSAGNGAGLVRSELDRIALEVGLTLEEFGECVDSEKFADEISEDDRIAREAELGGTPSIILGVQEGNTVEGIHIPGAFPYSVFEAGLNGLLEGKDFETVMAELDTIVNDLFQ